MIILFEAVLPGWSRRARVNGPGELPFPPAARLAFAGSVVLAHLLCWIWLRRSLRAGAPELLPRLARHPRAGLRHLATWWKEAALLTAELEAP